MIDRGCSNIIGSCAPRRITRTILRLGLVPLGAVLGFRTTTSQNCETVPRRAHTLLYHSTLGSKLIAKKRIPGCRVVLSVVLLSAISAGT